MPLARSENFRRPACRALPPRLALLFSLAGCAGLDDPTQRTGTWQPENMNDANLALMVADPRHLTQGVGDPSSPGVLSATAVQRLLTDHVKALPTTNVGPIVNSAAPTASGGTGGL